MNSFPVNPGYSSAFPSIDPETVRRWFADGAEFALLDVREAGQFGEGHPFFAASLPYSRLEIDAPRLLPALGVRIALLDAADGIAEASAVRLRALGYTSVSIVQRGVHGWADAGLTLFKGVSVPSKTFGEWVEHRYRTPHLGAAELQRRRNAGERLIVLDGRTPEEYSRMTIPGSTSCPNGELAYRIDDLVDDESTGIVVNCAGRTRSIIGAQTLIDLGIRNPVFALENGTQGWALGGFELEHGATRHHAARVSDASRALARGRAMRLASRYGVETVDIEAARRWLADSERSTYVFDVRTREEFTLDPVPGAVHVPGGQLLQNTDQYVGVRRGRILLVDDDGTRASVVASWLIRMGYEAAVLEPGTGRDAELDVSTRWTETWPPLDHVVPTGVMERVVGTKNARGAVRLVDLRSSTAWCASHVLGARWSIRSQLVSQLRASGAELDDFVVLIADRLDVAGLASRDLREAGFSAIAYADANASLWRSAGFEIVEGDDLPRAARIDYLFFAHDRHSGNLNAARQYLAWEQGLIAQCSPTEIGVFERADRSDID
ncbi:Rhodanese-related sulfurtransferase [Paraburkholderia unamae]|uniref:rhodanese-like domain-containing protein n=1 Tax=Paraburkholderia unamae TaxID=219649 RepID=UPI001CAF6AED|nr:rhodanese-like domain-containing protein [Paraburkholderia unamae]CAG9251810.1 Rhodanese-related sulfurtransferase [Paraburkholderia unamae]